MAVGDDNNRSGMWVTVIVTAIVTALIAWAVFAWIDNDNTARDEPGVDVVEDRSAGGESGAATLSRIVDEPQDYYGQRVTISGAVEDELGVNAVTLGAEDSDDRILVVGKNIEGLQDGQTVQVTGVVREFDLAEIEEELGADLDDNLFADFAGRPVVVATNISGQ